METFWARGGSMFPFVPSNSVLYVTAAHRASIRAGDVVCYPAGRQIVAHRVVRIEHGPRGRVFVTRGDASRSEERVEERAVAYVVTRVEHGRFAYDLDGPLGQLAAAVALRRGLMLHAAQRVATLAVGARGRLCRRERTRPKPQPMASVELATSEMPPPPKAASSESPDALLLLLNHELRTPLNGILGFVEVLLGELDGPLAVEERENLAFVRDAGRQLLSLVSDVLDLVAAVATEHEPQYESIDLGELLESERAYLEERRGMRPVYVRVDVPDEASVLMADASELSRVVRVVGELALQATASGEVSLSAATAGSAVQVIVRADGPLFPSLLPRADRPSSPAERDDRLRRLRLDMANRLVERTLGKLDVRTTTIEGSAVTLTVPRDGRTWVRGPATRSDIPLAIRYLAATGHDLRTPLNAILGFSDLVAMHPHEAWSEAQQRSLSIVRERARDLASMVDDMIDWAKLEVRDLKLSQRLHPARLLIERAVSMAVERSGERGLTVKVEVEPALDQVRVDADRFIQALLGLMDHAVRATPAATVTLRARRVAADGHAPPSARFEVIDPGLEIRQKDQAHIFAAFRPSFAPTGQRVAGLHLGTAVARALFRAHGGDVWFESRPSQGTTFVASLPDACLA